MTPGAIENAKNPNIDTKIVSLALLEVCTVCTAPLNDYDEEEIAVISRP